MESAGFRHRRSPSSDRFLGIFSLSALESVTGSAPSAAAELIEAEVFWTTDFAEPPPSYQDHRHRSSFSKPQNSGILAVLPEIGPGSQVLRQKASISPPPSPIPVIPRPPAVQDRRDYSQSVPNQKLRQSAPVKVPVPARADRRDYSQSVPNQKLRQSAPVKVPVPARAVGRRGCSTEVFEDEDDDDDEDQVLPPHEIVVRGSGVSPKTTFSVLEGAGRTLKGRDLRQVRNAIWRKTGFLD
ncbi:Senescence regulator [Trema orientale]|uniref:Senescence regulator n=1 Tax=Trema orientale TaxID=63057 RepID=A0A2P5EBG2_TREOI|nr:Senescence regulator [Trema orientale]